MSSGCQANDQKRQQEWSVKRIRSRDGGLEVDVSSSVDILFKYDFEPVDRGSPGQIPCVARLRSRRRPRQEYGKPNRSEISMNHSLRARQILRNFCTLVLVLAGQCDGNFSPGWRKSKREFTEKEERGFLFLRTVQAREHLLEFICPLQNKLKPTYPRTPAPSQTLLFRHNSSRHSFIHREVLIRFCLCVSRCTRWPDLLDDQIIYIQAPGLNDCRAPRPRLSQVLPLSVFFPALEVMVCLAQDLQER